MAPVPVTADSLSIIFSLYLSRPYDFRAILMGRVMYLFNRPTGVVALVCTLVSLSANQHRRYSEAHSIP